ncbi:MAG: hypothetical protein LKI18_08125 [Prevotella sp.]|nr:hypothetical protein [Prevotella sp.]
MAGMIHFLLQELFLNPTVSCQVTGKVTDLILHPLFCMVNDLTATIMRIVDTVCLQKEYSPHHIS